MKRIALAGIILICTGVAARAQPSPPSPDFRNFELTAIAPPVPALKYRLIFDDLNDRRPGNAAILYLDSILLMGQDAQDQAKKALDAYAAGDTKTFDSLADSLENHGLFQELDLASRRETCDWQPPTREMGAWTLLPHLAPMAHGLTPLIKIRALRQMEQGHAEDAVETLRLGYEMADNVGKEPLLISGLVSNAIAAQMNDALAQLMNRAECPNLYWALVDVPPRHEVFQVSMAGERDWWVKFFPNSNTPASDYDLATRARLGENLSADQWREIIDYAWSDQTAFLSGNRDGKAPTPPDAVKDAGETALKQATDLYAQRHNMTPQQVAGVDPVIVMGEFYFFEYKVAVDDLSKLCRLPYPELTLLANKSDAHFTELSQEQPANPFVAAVPAISRAVSSFGRVDRQLAALTVVEAIRSYAAANAGRLPQHLEDITDTPAPNNPMTGRPFEYRVSDDQATLSDTQTDVPLTYRISIRQ